jgi:Flp pilus assembly protein TadG
LLYGGQETERGHDRGSVSLYLAIFAIAAFALLALLVDGGTAINAKERAADIAEQAARAAVNQVDVGDLRSNNPTVVIGPGACEAAANIVDRYPMTSHTTARMTNCNAPVGATTATVYVSVQTTPVFPAFFGSFTMTSHASAKPVCGITQGGQC